MTIIIFHSSLRAPGKFLMADPVVPKVDFVARPNEKTMGKTQTVCPWFW